MKILVVSDSHGCTGYLLQAIEKEQPQHLIHLGDGYSDLQQVQQYHPHLPVTQVSGNCDFFADCPKERLVELEGVGLFLCHGHTRGVKMGLHNAYFAAREKEAQVLLFGHTHQPLHDKAGDLTVLNPGSIGYDGRYGVMELAKGQVVCHLEQI